MRNMKVVGIKNNRNKNNNSEMTAEKKKEKKRKMNGVLVSSPAQQLFQINGDHVTVPVIVAQITEYGTIP